MATSFDKVLVANRGEIAVRVMATLRRMGLSSVAVYSDADVDARHVAVADESVHIGPGPALQSYLDAGALLDAARATGAQALHPGYGFLSEDAAFARACVGAGLVFIGPPPEAVELMGDKIRAKQAVAASGVPVVPGTTEAQLSDDELADAVRDLGFPVLLKPSAGGGGKGMHLVRDAEELASAIAMARREAKNAFGNDELLVERFVEHPRHVEIQVFADHYGAVVHLGERECSLQRRHQKIVEEAPSPLLDETIRQAMGHHAVEAARRCGYVGAGTVEFVVSGQRPSEHYFLEMNTRLQVEHAVTELVTGLDLVELQIRVAQGEPLSFGQEDVVLRGHAVEARVYAEDPARGFLPTGGPVLVAKEAALPHVRVDSSLKAGTMVTTLYDPLLAKVISWAPDRTGALQRLRRALDETTVLGLTTNVAFLSDLLADDDVVAGRLDTGLVDRFVERAQAVQGGGIGGDGLPTHVVVAAAMVELAQLAEGRAGGSRFDVLDGWRLGGHAWIERRYVGPGGHDVAVRYRGTAARADVVVEGRHGAAFEDVEASLSGCELIVTVAGHRRQYCWATSQDAVWIREGGPAVVLYRQALAGTSGRVRSTAMSSEVVRSPMPGSVVAVLAAVGDMVEEGEALVVVEAMKMEHALVAPHDGVIVEVAVEVGSQVGLDEVVVTVRPDGATDGGGASRPEAAAPVAPEEVEVSR